MGLSAVKSDNRGSKIAKPIAVKKASKRKSTDLQTNMERDKKNGVRRDACRTDNLVVGMGSRIIPRVLATILEQSKLSEGDWGFKP
jgi:hypothetical protein